MADVEVSCGLPPGPDFAELAVLAEELGYARVWIFDSAPLWEDPFVHLALAAVRTTRIGLATAVLIPSQRSVMTMASGIATIAALPACPATDFAQASAPVGPRARRSVSVPYRMTRCSITSAHFVGCSAGDTVYLDARPPGCCIGRA